MAFAILLIIYLLLFTILAWRNFEFALAFLFFCLPTYMIRFHIGPLPTTLLEVMIWIITAVWLIKFHKNIQYLISNIKVHKSLFIAISFFLLAATISVFTSINTRAALGEWKAFYFEPIILFIIVITTISAERNSAMHQISNIQFPMSKLPTKIFNLQSSIFFALALCGLITSILSIIQHYTGWMVPNAFWANRETYRVTAWYGFPNAVGLFLAPIWPLALYLLLTNKKQETNNIKYPTSNILISISCVLYLVFSPIAIYFARSTGSIVALVAGLLFFLFFYNKKTRIIACLVGLVSIIGLVSLPANNTVKQELLFQDRSGQLRINMWAETTEFLKAHPITGAGLASYSQLIKPYRIDKWIEVFHHPHNLFLTMWVNLGLLGLFAFVWLIIWFFKYSISNIQYPISTKYITTSMLIILVVGLVDSPYIKNDLAIFFWLLPALILGSLRLVGGGQEGVSQSQTYERLENHKT